VSRHHRNKPWVDKVKNRAWMTLFCTQNITTMFEGHFLSFPVISIENCFGQILTTIPGTGITGAGKLEYRTRITRFCTQNIPTLFWVRSYHFSSIRLINVSVKFLRLFRVRTPPEQALRGQSSKRGPHDSVLHPKHTHNVWGYIFYRFLLVWLKIILVKFWRLVWVRTPSE